MPGKAISTPPEGAPPIAERTFAEPWQAEVFALAVALSERGLFTWGEWAERLGAALREGEGGEEAYWRAWVAALESLVAERADLTGETIAERTAAWQRAAQATPHGLAITLENDPLR